MAMSGYDAGEMLAGLREWVEIETPTDTPKAVDRLVEKDFAALGAATRRIPGQKGFADCLRCARPGGRPGRLPGIWSRASSSSGTLERLPFSVAGDVAYGPGIYDMKGGGFIGFHVFRQFVRANRTSSLPISPSCSIRTRRCVNSDGRGGIIEEAKQSKFGWCWNRPARAVRW